MQYKDGAGHWTLAGAGAYPGATTITAGVLRIANGAALGATSAGTTVFDGGTLELFQWHPGLRAAHDFR